jgi:hypothetical protein
MLTPRSQGSRSSAQALKIRAFRTRRHAPLHLVGTTGNPGEPKADGLIRPPTPPRGCSPRASTLRRRACLPQLPLARGVGARRPARPRRVRARGERIEAEEWCLPATGDHVREFADWLAAGLRRQWDRRGRIARPRRGGAASLLPAPQLAVRLLRSGVARGSAAGTPAFIPAALPPRRVWETRRGGGVAASGAGVFHARSQLMPAGERSDLRSGGGRAGRALVVGGGAARATWQPGRCANPFEFQHF